MPSCGYASPRYGESFAEFGEVLTLPGSGLQVIRRDVVGDRWDVTGVYPYSAGADWSRLDDDLGSLRALGAVSIVFVVGPFAEPQARRALGHWSLCARFKTHFVVDLRQDWRALRTQNVRHCANQARRLHTIEVVDDPPRYADHMWELYQATAAKHGLTGIPRLSRRAIAAQLEVDGCVLVLARRDGEVRGAMLSYARGAVGEIHLLGQTPDGYRTKTSYGLYHRSLEELQRRGCEHVNLGGPAGLRDDPEDGLFQFKKRWTRERGASLLCGEVVDADAYRALTDQAAQAGSAFFPAYRAPGGPFEWRPSPQDAERA